MKIKIIIYSLVAVALSLTSCKDFLTEIPESALTQDNFYTTPTRINQGVLGCYAGLATLQKEEWMFTELRSDNTCQDNPATTNVERRDQADLSFFRVSSSFVAMENYWYATFQNIANINSVLPSVTDNRYVSIESQRAQYESELLFLRAYHYYNLVNLFGDMFKVTSIMGPNEAKKTPRSPVSEIYNEIIIPDLIKAQAAPAAYSDQEKGRITVWAVKSLLAKVYMMQGGSENLAKAKTLLEEVIAAPQHGLVTPYSAIFQTSNEMNREIIFAVRYKGGSDGVGSPFWNRFAPAGSATRFVKRGTPSGYNTPTFEIMSLFNADPTDTRADACFRVWQRSADAALPYISKYIDDAIEQAMQAENDWIVIRYADVKLLYAEVLAQDGNHATAHIPVNEIRTRAGISALNAFSSKEDALDAVYAERRLELAFENHRWFDLLRMNKSYNNPNKAMSVLKYHTFTCDWDALYNEYSALPKPEEINFINERLLLPIPQWEIDTNNEINIPQNPTY